MKGETSGNTLKVTRLQTDCDDDTVLVRVQRQGDGNVCHTGERTASLKNWMQSYEAQIGDPERIIARIDRSVV
ncbi:MAG: hypothetical protein CM1200mP25_0830 [Acidobacteriota bacterium]|nr:MAG: hypothetical protein CM1200mP25_0830 [Acidobacteriota bacterium]